MPKNAQTTAQLHSSHMLAMEKAMAPHSSTLAWKIPWMEEPGRLQSMGSQRVEHDWTTSLSFFTFMHWRRKWQPTAVFFFFVCLFYFFFKFYFIFKHYITVLVFLAWRIPGRGSLVGCHLWGRRVGHDWSNLAAAAAAAHAGKVMLKIL